MKMIPALGLIALISATPGQAGPWSGADCVATSDRDLGGSSLPTTHDQEAQNVSGALTFVPASFYIADGYGVKVFTAPIFGGDGLYIGGIEDLAQPEAHHLKATDGGHYANVADLGLSGAVQSFACVAIGQAFPASGSLADGLAYFNDRSFGLTGYRGNHPDYSSVAVTFHDGKKLVSASQSSSYGTRSTSQVLDLDSGTITITEFVSGAVSGVPQTFVRNQAGYVEAVKGLRAMIGRVAANNAGERRPDKWAPIANLELLPLFNRLGSL